MSYTGHIQNGVVVFDEPVSLPDGTAVKVVHEATSGLCYEGNVLVHRGSCSPTADPSAANRDSRFEQLIQGLPR